MCTVTWLAEPDGYHVLFNRDEKKAREPATPPEIRTQGALKFIAPFDGRAGGTWLAANEKGLAVGLLNHYGAQEAAPQGRTSRGLLVVSLMDCASIDEIRARMQSLDRGEFSPFYLVAFETDRQPVRFLWDGSQLDRADLTDGDRPLTTSSFRTDEVVAERRVAFEDLAARAGGVSLGMLNRYHAGRSDRGDAYSVFMRREDAETVSFSRVTVKSGSVEFYYAPRDAEGDAFPRGVANILPRA